jgi:hypothetical protein
MSQRKDLLLALINDVHSTAEERSAAHKELYGSAHQMQEGIDREIASYLNFDRSLGMKTLIDHRQSLSTGAKQLIDDMSYTCSFGMAPDVGTEERLNSLLARTSSDLIKIEVIRALRVIALLKNSGGQVYVNTQTV